MQRENGSFRDRSGFVFYEDGKVYRVINESYKSQYDYLLSSGLNNFLIEQELLIPQQELLPGLWPEAVSESETGKQIYKIVQPEKVQYISYPYEWCFQQLKDAALLTLEIQLKALEYNMTLKDASVFNVQFRKGKPIFIDTLSFDHYKEGEPWIAYRQFCTHFLAPLAIMSNVTTDLARLSQLYIDGIPLQVASALLPLKTRISTFYFLHIHYHAKLDAKYSDNIARPGKIKRQLSKTKLTRVIHHLASGIQSMKLKTKKSEWANYYKEFSYSDVAIENKKQIVKEWVSALAPKIVWDLGCNTGMFSELVQPFCELVVSFDNDHLAIEKFYADIKRKSYKNILSLVLDLNNPSAAIGWANRERKPFIDRGKADLILALALIHHLCIGNNVPLFDMAEYMSNLSEWLLIEFIPKKDPQVQRLLVIREDIFSDYTQESFERAFEKFFSIRNKQLITETERTLYLMKRK